MSPESTTSATGSTPSILGELDLYFLGEGHHYDLADHLGAHIVDGGTSFAVWAPSARAVHVIGDHPGWEAPGQELEPVGSSGIWAGVVAGATEGDHYRYRITDAHGGVVEKADPVAFAADLPPSTASLIHTHGHTWGDDEWMQRRADSQPLAEPMSIYEVHLGSWRRDPAAPDREMSYAELAQPLAEYVKEMGFTHIELMPVMAHPFAGSWGYQVTSYYAPSPKWGSPDDFAAFVDVMHQNGIGVILDWVPAHFPRDEFSLGRFDGTALYEHEDPRRGAHPDWGTLEFNFGRHEVSNFLIANALFWLRRFHVDGLRVDAVASMLYLDYSRQAGEWVPNRYGGREDLEAVEFLKQLNTIVHAEVPGVIVIAEESTAWPGVSRPVDAGGLGFTAKWNMGWMHDTLAYFAEEPINRRHHQGELTFSLVYAFSENFVLPLSHDEVVHGKGSMINKMPGDRWQRLANLRALYALMWAHPGKQLLFMGCEFAQEREWSHERSLDWHLLGDPGHHGLQRLVAELNHRSTERPALWSDDFEGSGFEWITADDAEQNVIAFLRWGRAAGTAGDERPVLVCAANLSPVPRAGYRLGLPVPGRWRVVIDTDDDRFGGSSAFAGRTTIVTEPLGWQGQAHSAPIDLPPLAVVWLEPDPVAS